jgi:hypothetical protein
MPKQTPETKAIIELDQMGTPLRVLVAKKGPGEPLVDLTEKGVIGKPDSSHKKLIDMEFYEGNCVWINGSKYCS